MTFFWQNPVLQGNARMSDKINVDQLAKLFDLPTWDDVEEMNLDYISEAARGLDDEEEEMAAMTAARDEVYSNWHDAVMSVAHQLFGEHDLELEPVRQRRGAPAYEFRIKPIHIHVWPHGLRHDWKHSAMMMLRTINGVGYFQFDSLKDFLDSGPYTPRQAVLSHLGYIARYPEVYGTMMSARQMYEGSWR